MKRIDPKILKGKATEERAVEMIRSLIGEFDILSAERTNRVLDAGKVDILVVMVVNGEIRRIPIQMKSSVQYALSFMKKNHALIRQGVLVLAINEGWSDEEVRQAFRDYFIIVIQEDLRFEHILSRIERKGLEESVRPRPKKTSDFRRKQLLKRVQEEDIQEQINDLFS